MHEDEWVTNAEDNFRKFMKALNRLGGGIVFEALDDEEMEQFVGQCVASAKAA